eukprot:g1464.t1
MTKLLRVFYTNAFICILLFCPLLNSVNESLNQKRVEFEVGEVIDAASAIVVSGQRDKLRLAPHCECALHSCSNRLDAQLECTERLGSLSSCGQSCTTRKVSFKRFFITTPPNADPENLSDGIVQDSCIYQLLDELCESYTGHISSWVYFGSAHGASISWPGVAHARGLNTSESDQLLGNCEQYDPRIRPWYLEATSAPRNMIILVDASASMEHATGSDSNVTRWDLAIQVTKAVLSVTRFSDAITLIPLTEQRLNNSMTLDLIEGTEEGQTELLANLDQIQPRGDKRIQEGLHSAFQILKRAEENEIRTTGCQKVVLLITDGHLCTRNSLLDCLDEHKYMTRVLETLKTDQESLKTSNSASVFVITLGEDADSRLAKHIACQNNALWIPVHPTLDILEQMSSFISFFANQVIENEEQIIWSRFYEDFSGLGGFRGKLVGVVAYDIRIADLEANGLRYAEILGQLSQHIGECKVYTINPCQLQILRGQEHSCPVLYPSSRCYKHHESIIYSSSSDERHLSFDQAVEFCKAEGGRLAEIATGEDQMFYAGISALQGSWIGLNRSESGNWRWISGEAASKKLKNSIRDIKGRWCVALDSSSIKDNINARFCSDELPFFCQFRARRNKSISICQGQVHEDDNAPSSNHTSFQNCFEALTPVQKRAILDDSEFKKIRLKRNQNPVFCPMGLDEERNPLEAQCCSDCLNFTISMDLNYAVEEENLLQLSSTTSTLTSFHNSFHPYLLIVLLSTIYLFIVF